jgi:hypothetical protein
MENLLTFVVAIIIAWSIFVAYIEGDAGGVRREENPRGFWAMVSLGIGGLGGLIVWASAE